MSCCEDAGRGSILFSILNRRAEAQRTCSCAPVRKLVAIRSPYAVFQSASEVLVKTFRFVKNVPCFRGLPVGDQLRLVRSSWAPLLVLGLVQDDVDLDTVETQQPGLLHRILTHSSGEVRDPGVPVTDVEGIQMFVGACRELRISVKELAFLKGAVLFTSGGTQLECRDYIEALQREAERALFEHVKTEHRGSAGRSGRLRALLSALRRMDPEAVAGLFFRPVMGARGAAVEEHVLALFYERT
ncbi:nuclear receptor subfamily 0 group B member 1-like [Aulostomus maculatus]